MKKCREQRMILTEVRARENTDTVFGYAAKFDSYSDHLGGYIEIIQRGAFKKTLSDGADVRLLVNHEGIPIGRTKSGTLTLREDATGLYFESKLDPSNPTVAELKSAMSRGDIDQCSFGFFVHKDSWGRDAGGYPVRTIVEAELFDVSIVTIPAYPATNVALRSLFNDSEKLSQLFEHAESEEFDRMITWLSELKAKKSQENVTTEKEIVSKVENTNNENTEEPIQADHSVDSANEIQPNESNLSAVKGRENEIKLLEI